METTSYHQYIGLVPVSISIQNVRNRNDSKLAMKDLTLRRIAANRIIIIHLHRPKLFCVDHTASTARSMADESDKNSRLGDDLSALNINKNKEEAEERPEKLPPQPEKPLPGDCCGSGCVRCVWDVYYEELEDYNKLVSESESESKSKSKDQS